MTCDDTLGSSVKRAVGAAVLLLALVNIVYLPAMRGGYLWDDDEHVPKPSLRSLDGLRRTWFDLGATQQYYPLTYTAFWFEHRLWSDATVGYHIVNVMLHSAAAWLAYLVLRGF